MDLMACIFALRSNALACTNGFMKTVLTLGWTPSFRPKLASAKV